MAVLREAREARTPSRWATPLRVAAAVVLLAGAAAGGVYAWTQLGRGEDAAVTAEGDGAGAPEEQAPAAAEDEAERSAQMLAGPYPQVRRTGAEHDPSSIVDLAARLREDAGLALEEGLPSDAFGFYDAYPVDSFRPAAREALVCAGQGLEPEPSVVPFVIEEATWEGQPAWIISYLQGPDPSAAYDRLQILVVQRETCAVLHFAQQRL